MTGEAKHRKPQDQDSCESDVPLDMSNSFGHDSNKSHRNAGHAIRMVCSRMLRRIATRQKDVTAMGGLWLSWILGYLYSTTELLQPADFVIVRCFSLVAHVLFLLAMLSWIGVIFHGPGRVPAHQGSGSQLPEPLADCLEAGKHLKSKPFDSKDGWCQKCAHWKPALANHCSVCGRCCLWMDHHCNFAGQCMGFRNLRNFLLMQLYTQLLIIIHMPLAVRRLWLEPYPFFDWVAGIKLLIFVGVGFQLRRLVRYFFSSVLGKISRGWPSYVLMCKFGCLMEHAQTVEQKAYARARKLSEDSSDSPSPALERLRNLQHRVLIPSRFGGANLRGIFPADRFLQSVAFVFGEPPSWRWLNPLKAGGVGDPVSPMLVDADACQAWAELGPILRELHELSETEDARLKVQQQSANAHDGRAKQDGITTLEDTSLAGLNMAEKMQGNYDAVLEQV